MTMTPEPPPPAVPGPPSPVPEPRRPGDPPGQVPERGQGVVARRDAYAAARDMYVNVLLQGPRAGAGWARDGAHGYRRERSLFIQYLNPEILACYGKDVARGDATQVLTQALTATRLAVLLTDAYLIFPSSYMFELPWFDVFLGCIDPLVHEGLVRHTSPTPELAAYRDMKAREYRRDETNPYVSPASRHVRVEPDLGWYPRHGRPTTDGIADLWGKALAPEGELSAVVHAVARAWHRPYRRVEKIMSRSPERLEGQAFVPRFVRGTLPGPVPGQAGTLLGLFISAAYLRCYVRDLDTAILTDLPLGPLSCALDGSEHDMGGRVLSSRRLDLALRWLRVDHFVHRGASWKELIRLRSSPEFGMIASMLYGNGSADAFRLAIIAAGRSRHFRPAATCGDALSNVAAAADHLARALA
ncbi:hypothetical protein [Sphaerisporangium sp. TRM90804]|uniref:hypothetical protein n=1 Tax=Sphaerisporangium sp. TRM90804 TaxID=3031113 RepID=UPI0024471D78|nr:hypothetical protein [Sphaerisporangium sp. TRM90804]MDH2429119.1 hypothetical protein [Sphaerisporangium sp. TRM90804]